MLGDSKCGFRADVLIGNLDTRRESVLIKCVIVRRLCVNSRE